MKKEVNGLLVEEELRKLIPNIAEILSKNFDIIIKLKKDSKLKILLSRPINLKADR